uniref:Uncharacterized protein n=1 Tax=Marmota marmota marmota TaxID=9994 RepID=A0A8C5Z8D2_MARMA
MSPHRAPHMQPTQLAVFVCLWSAQAITRNPRGSALGCPHPSNQPCSEPASSWASLTPCSQFKLYPMSCHTLPVTARLPPPSCFPHPLDPATLTLLLVPWTAAFSWGAGLGPNALPSPSLGRHGDMSLKSQLCTSLCPPDWTGPRP